MWAPSRTPPDSTTVSIAKVNSDYKQLDIAIVKATNHVERPAKEKYIRGLGRTWPTASAPSPCLSKTRNWAVVLKTLIVIHRALREVDPSFLDELMSNGRSSGQMLHMSYFKDDSSPNGSDYPMNLKSNLPIVLKHKGDNFSILEPIKAGIRDAKLGVGKQEQDDFFTASANFCIFF
ncbi:putative clathrin assembly protein [Hordeum vulgare]|nr:putative clathrin assembly protein [Hordeum vulgare]